MAAPKRRNLLLTASLLTTATASGVRAAQHSEEPTHETTRRLQQHKHRTLSAWSQTSVPIRPLDLKLDESDPSKVYQVGIGGFLEPYDEYNYQQDFVESTHHLNNPGGREGPALSSSSSALSEGGGNAEGVVHYQSERLPLTNFDLNRWTALQGFSDVERKLDGESSSGVRKLKITPDFFKYNEHNDPYDLPDEADANTDVDVTTSRNLKKNQANSFADDEAPIVRSTFPPVNTKIGPNQSFGALVSDDGTGVKSVCLQLRDHVNSLSDCFELVNVGRDVYELTFDGFDAYEGMTWSYRVRSKDKAKNRVNTPWADFIINISGKGQSQEEEEERDVGAGDSGGGTGVLTEEVSDESWPYGGLVQKSTGRILFFFDGNAYVCTGTVLDDEVEDRTVILTAAHCAYQYRPQGGRFAEHALFIPDQDSTIGTKSDETCSNDPYGCWIPAFAVVDYRWTQQGFPNSVPYDYAFYVIPNDIHAHEKGYLHYGSNPPSQLLPEVAEPIPVDWEYNHYASDFTTGLGYSFDKDPDFRYCAGDMSTKFGIKTYENLWIGVCEMTGGSSGGPWMVNTDSEGRGTVVSVNSWGYTSSSGMAGPNLSTGEAKCMYEKAKSRSLYDYGGLIVTDCAN
jgi:hypothetical protein